MRVRIGDVGGLLFWLPFCLRNKSRLRGLHIERLMSRCIDHDSLIDPLILDERIFDEAPDKDKGGRRGSNTSVFVHDVGNPEAWRWVVLILFFLSGAANALVLLTWSPITDSASTYFGDIGITAINILTVCFQIMYLPGTLLAVHILKNYDLRTTILSAGIFTTVGCAVRYIGSISQSQTSSYFIVLLGTLFVAIAQPFYLNMPARLATAWFGVKERGVF